ncbi:MAG TPA: hypothetical protein VF525_08460, partial [Pyrinomonadaceae bacterium]
PRRLGRRPERLEIVTAGSAAAIAIYLGGLARALAIGTTILAAFVSRATTARMRAHTFVVSHRQLLLCSLIERVRPTFYSERPNRAPY